VRPDLFEKKYEMQLKLEKIAALSSFEVGRAQALFSKARAQAPT
jgi:hypothetical protein